MNQPTPPRHTVRRRRATRLAIVLAASLFGTASAAPVTLNLKDADIGALVASISEITGKNFIVDPRVKARVTVISAKPMDEAEIYEVFQAILAVHGFAAIPGDKVIKIVPEANAKQESIPTVGSGDDSGDDQVVTRVIQVENVAAAQIVPILRPLIPPQGHLAAYAPTNVLIVSDRAANVERVANIISRVDLASNEEIEIVALRHASASDVLRVLNSLEQGRKPAAEGSPAAPSRMVADERTNSILLSGDRNSRIRLRTLITHLDTPLEATGNTQVVYLRYAKAKELLPVLQGVSGRLQADGSASTADPAAGTPAPASTGGPAGGRIDIQADEATNSLVLTGPVEAIRSLRSVIGQLDVRRAQVLVEAAIAELSYEQSAQLGVQWLVDGSQAGTVAGLTNFNGGSGIIGLAQAALTENLGALPVVNGLAAAAGNFDSRVRFAALVNALAADADTNILSTPTLVTLDNQEAEIIVGQNVPFVTGSFTTNTNTSSNPFQTIQRQDVGLTLKIKPQINEGDAVMLEVAQEVSSVVPSAGAALQGPTTNKRAIRTQVMVEDGQVLVLGGLIDDTLSETVQKVPGLGDVPLLGELFRYRSTSRGKRNLMIFLHPVILRDGLQGSEVTNAKYTHIRGAQLAARQRGVALLPEAETPVMPALEEVHRERSLSVPGALDRADEAAAPAPASRYQHGYGDR